MHAQALDLWDPQPLSLADLCSHFYATEADVAAGLSRAEAAARQLALLNPHCTVSVVSPRREKSWGHVPAPLARDGVACARGLARRAPAPGTEASRATDGATLAADEAGSQEAATAAVVALVASGRYGAAVAVDQPLARQLAVDDAARTVGGGVSDGAGVSDGGASRCGLASRCGFVACGVRGVFGSVFSDFGHGFEVRDPTGQPPVPAPLQGLAIAPEGTSKESNGGGKGTSTTAAGATTNDDADGAVHLLVDVRCAEGEPHGLSTGQRVEMLLNWRGQTHAPPAQARKWSRGSRGGSSSGGGGGRVAWPAALEGVVERVVNRETCAVRLDAVSSAALRTAQRSAQQASSVQGGESLGGGDVVVRLPELASGTVKPRKSASQAPK